MFMLGAFIVLTLSCWLCDKAMLDIAFVLI